MALTNTFPAPKGATSDSLAARKALAGLVVRSAAGVPRAGVFPRHADPLVTPRSDMQVDVAAFEALLVRRGGASPIANDGAMAVNIGTKPNSGTRYHVLYLRQNETEFADANLLAAWGYTMGDTEALADGQVPEGGLIFATIAIPSSATSTQQTIITQRFLYTTTAGGVLWFRSKAEQDAFTAARGQQAYRLDTSAPWVREASGWVGPFLAQARKSGAQNTNTDAGLGAVVLWDSDAASNDPAAVETLGVRVPYAGRYAVHLRFRVPDGGVYGRLVKNQNVVLADTEAGCTNIGTVTMSTVLTLAAGDLIQGVVYRLVNGAAAIAPAQCGMDVRYLGRQ